MISLHSKVHNAATDCKTSLLLPRFMSKLGHSGLCWYNKFKFEKIFTDVCGDTFFKNTILH